MNTAPDIYPFQEAEKQELFNKLLNELRCSSCLHRPLKDSPANEAEDLRQVIYQKVQAGENENTILEFVSSRYGEHLMYHPHFGLDTMVLWLGPFFMLMMVFIILYRHLKNQQKRILKGEEYR